MREINNYLPFRIKDSADWQCVHCGWKAKSYERIDIVVHNIDSNPQVLCCDCHDLEHGRELPPKRARFLKQRKAKLQKKSNCPRRQYSSEGWPI